jgi:N-acylneuraminate cytidylyltransferase
MAVIFPIKDHSSRFPGKTFRPFHNGKNLLQIKLEQLLAVFNRSDIVAVVDGPEGRGFATQHHLETIDDSHVNSTGFEWAVRYWYSEIRDNDAVMLAYPTTPLFNYFGEMVDAWNRNEYDSIFAGSTLRHFVTDEVGRPLNFQYGYFHRTSEFLPKWVLMDWSCFIIDGQIAPEVKYPIGRTPQVFLQPPPSIDIDNEEDFEFARWHYERKQKYNWTYP